MNWQWNRLSVTEPSHHASAESSLQFLPPTYPRRKQFGLQCVVQSHVTQGTRSRGSNHSPYDLRRTLRTTQAPVTPMLARLSGIDVIVLAEVTEKWNREEEADESMDTSINCATDTPHITFYLGYPFSWSQRSRSRCCETSHQIALLSHRQYFLFNELRMKLITWKM